jgi:hypothetical protein
MMKAVVRAIKAAVRTGAWTGVVGRTTAAADLAAVATMMAAMMTDGQRFQVSCRYERGATFDDAWFGSCCV